MNLLNWVADGEYVPYSCWGNNAIYKNLATQLFTIRFIRFGLIPLILIAVPTVMISIGCIRLAVLKNKKKKDPNSITDDSIIDAKHALKRDIIISIIVVIICILISPFLKEKIDVINQKIIDVCNH